MSDESDTSADTSYGVGFNVPTEDFTLLSIGVFVILLRVFARWKDVGPAKWQLDDYLMPLLAIVYGVSTWTNYHLMTELSGFTNSYSSDEERAMLIDVDRLEYDLRQAGSKAAIVAVCLYVFTLWALKLCLAVFYSRLTERLSNLTLRVRLAYVLLGVTYLAVQLTILLSCQPLSKFWQINPNPGNSCQPAISRVFVYVVCIPNVFTDLYLLSIPLPLLWKVNIDWRRKIVLVFLFSGAIFSMITSIVRADIIMHDRNMRSIHDGTAWANRETCIAITVTNLPILHPLLRKCVKKLGQSSALLGGKRSGSGTNTSHELSNLSRRRRPVHPLDADAWGSDEHILVAGDDRKQSGVTTSQPSNGIFVNQEITITTEPAPTAKIGRSASDALQRRTGEGSWDIATSSRPVAARFSTRSVRIGAEARV
ncbi:hypothetical protein F4819DRAFT_500765 [Hypoxylon fuscum]|nr:hypothetical protein F4819DRAFT_500765 [Hypoxylon fuscum]